MVEFKEVWWSKLRRCGGRVKEVSKTTSAPKMCFKFKLKRRQLKESFQDCNENGKQRTLNISLLDKNDLGYNIFKNKKGLKRIFSLRIKYLKKSSIQNI